MHTHPQRITLLLLAIASLACLPGTNAQELVGSTNADNPGPSRWATYQGPLWQPLAPARKNVLPMESSTPQASTRDNLRRQVVHNHEYIDAKLKQIELDYVDLGSMMAADVVRADADYHRPQLSNLDLELQQVANRVLSGVGYASGSGSTIDKISAPDFFVFQSYLDEMTAELTASVDDQLRASEQRVFELRHAPANPLTLASASRDSENRRVSQRPLKAALTDDEVQRLAEEFITQRTLERLQQRLSPVTLERATRLGYLKYLHQMIQQDNQVIAALSASSPEWSRHLRSVVELERAIAKKIDAMASTTATHECPPAPVRYSLISQAAGIVVRLE